MQPNFGVGDHGRSVEQDSNPRFHPHLPILCAHRRLLVYRQQYGHVQPDQGALKINNKVFKITYSRLQNKRTGTFINFEKFLQGAGPYLEKVRLFTLKVFMIYLLRFKAIFCI